MWRPKSWENDKFYKCMDLTHGGGEYSDIYLVFEAGADTILKALKEQGLHGLQSEEFPYSHSIPIAYNEEPVFTETGTLTFIPDN